MALDVSVRAQILNLMIDLQKEFDLTYQFISHDLSVVEYVADRVADTTRLFTEPKRPYTEARLSAIPKPDPDRRSQRIVLQAVWLGLRWNVQQTSLSLRG